MNYQKFKKWIIFGKDGQLGREWQEVFRYGQDLEWPKVFLFGSDVDISNRKVIKEIFSTIKPNVIINCAAYTNVDKAETDVTAAGRSNALGPTYLAELCTEYKSFLVHYSTDFIFDGKNAPYSEDDEPNPLSVYGYSKLLGERNIRDINDKHLILRTSWLYGNSPNNFVSKILNKVGTTLKVVDDQFGSPTNAKDLIDATYWLLGNDHTGTFNVCNRNTVSRFEWAEKILEYLKSGYLGDVETDRINKTKLERTSTKIPFSNRSQIAKRPHDSSLSLNKLDGIGYEMRDWNHALWNHMSDRYVNV